MHQSKDTGSAKTHSTMPFLHKALPLSVLHHRKSACQIFLEMETLLLVDCLLHFKDTILERVLVRRKEKNFRKLALERVHTSTRRDRHSALY